MTVNTALVNSSSSQAQPKALYVLFFAELWERFSFYGMKALLILYMTKQLMFNTDFSYGTYGAYGALLYGTNIIGGYLADSFLGNRRAILFGCIFIIAGHAALSLPLGEDSFYYGLGLLVVGTGFFKPNVSSFLGQFYKKNDNRRDSGFTIFYMGINIGGFFSPLVCGTVAELYGWPWGFGMAAIGMIFGAIVFYGGSKYYGDKGLPPYQDLLDQPILFGLSLSKMIFIGSILFVPLVVALIKNQEYMSGFLTVTGLTIFVILSILAMRSPAEERKCIFTLLIMFFFVTLFFSIWEQVGGSILLFTDENVNRTIGSFTAPAAWSQSLNPLMIVIFTPILAGLYSLLAKMNINLLTPVKFIIGFIASALGFYMFLIGIKSSTDGVVGLQWLILGIAGFTLGELFISPVGLSMVTKLSPKRFASLLMGVFFLAMGMASFLSQKIAQLHSAPESMNRSKTTVELLSDFEGIFTFVTQLAIGSAIAMIILTPVVYGVFKRHQ